MIAFTLFYDFSTLFLTRYRENLFSHFPFFSFSRRLWLEHKKQGQKWWRRLPTIFHLHKHFSYPLSSRKKCFVYLRKIIYVYFSCSDGLKGRKLITVRKAKVEKGTEEGKNVKSLRLLLANIFLSFAQSCVCCSVLSQIREIIFLSMRRM